MKINKKLKSCVFLIFLCISGICFFSLEEVQAQMADRLGLTFEDSRGKNGENEAGDISGTDQGTISPGDSQSGGRPASGGNSAGNGSAGELPVSSGDGAGPGGEQAVSGGNAAAGDTGKKEWSYMTVEDDYFNDALFIGDSRTVGLNEYGGLNQSTFYASTGLTVYKMFSAEIVPVPGSKKKITAEEALKEKQFAKIYLMIGINEMGTGTVETFMEKYKEQVEHLKELQPDAIIYLQAIMRVSTERSNKGDYITNEGINARNAEIAKLADNDRVFYLDANPLFSDETGGMVSSYTFDGVHLKSEYVLQWKQFLKEHAVNYS